MVGYEYEDLPVKHIRHWLDISQEGLEQLCNDKRVAIHWNDIESRNPDDYRNTISDPGDAESAAKDIATLNEVDETGAIVVADYSSDFDSRKGIHKNKLFAGVIPPNSFEYREYMKHSSGRGIYKTLKFDEATYQVIREADRPDIFSDRPARKTIQNCRKTEDRLRSLVDPSKSVIKSVSDT